MSIPALATNRPETFYVWRGSSLLIVEPHGWAGDHPLSGFFFRQARYLRDLRLLINGEAPYFCSLAESAPNNLELAYVFPEVERGGGGGSGSGGTAGKDGLLFRDLDLRLQYRVLPASLEATLWITNRWLDRVEVDLAWILSADYASVDEAQFGIREQEAEVEVRPDPAGVVFRYGHPDLPLETRVLADGANWSFAGGRLITRLDLLRQEPRLLRLRIRAVDSENGIDDAGEKQREARLVAWSDSTVRLDAPAETPLVEITNRAVQDLGSMALLDGADDEWLTPGAGVPLYQALWGRDAVTTAWQAGLFDRGEMLGDVLGFLGRRQGQRVDPERDEEPGRILNQAKVDPSARLGRSPLGRYYADFASPFMFVIGLGYRYVLTADRDQLREHWDAANRVLDWAREFGDRDGDGYLEYLTSAEHGPTHQGWKDSENAVVYEDGRQVSPPIAPCEVQGYHYVSLQYMAGLSALLGERKRGVELWKQASELKERFNRDFWMEEEGFVAFGLDAGKRQIRAITSNAGHCLATGIVSDEHIPRLVDRLFSPDLFSGWGIRTLSTGNPAYNPLDYHLGSVWPVENGTILFGLRRYGMNDRALELARALYDLTRLWPGGRTPECVGGYSRAEFAHPGTYPRANRPQTWNQSVLPLMVQSLLGLVPYAPLHLLLVDPILPEWLPDLTVSRLRVGDATATLRFWRDGDGESHFKVLQKEGKLHVVRQPWMESTSAGARDRLGGLMESVFRGR
jgi:glycogen debranching enzyme